MRLRFEHPLSDEDLERFCEENKPFQIERESNGELVVLTPAFTKYGRLECRISTALNNWAMADSTGDCFGPSSGFTLPDSSMRAADEHWISHTRWNALTPDQQEGFAQVCPEFVIEIRSNSDTLPNVRTKMQMWLRNGAELTWLIDPTRKTVEIYRPGQAPELHEEPTSVQGTGPIQGFELVITNIWS